MPKALDMKRRRSVERHPEIVFSGEQLSGPLLMILELRIVTFSLPVAMAPPALPVLNLIVECLRAVVPKFEMAPPSPPETLYSNVFRTMVDTPLPCVLIAPPLLGAVLLEKNDFLINSVPLLISPPPPTPVVVFKMSTLPSSVAIAPD
jgi:hypothetical protein